MCTLNLAFLIRSGICFPESCHLNFDFYTFIFHFMLDPDPNPEPDRTTRMHYGSRSGSAKSKSFGSGSGSTTLLYSFIIVPVLQIFIKILFITSHAGWAEEPPGAISAGAASPAAWSTSRRPSRYLTSLHEQVWRGCSKVVSPTPRLESTSYIRLANGDGHFFVYIQSWWYFRPSWWGEGEGSKPSLLVIM